MTTAQLNNFLNNFPTNATCWSQATDEVRDTCYAIRSYYNEMVLDVCEGDEGYVESLDFRSFRKPSVWNTKGREFIMDLFGKMTPQQQKNFSLTREF